MPTVADFVPDSAANQFVADEPRLPSITQDDPETYAGLTAQNALKMLWAQNLQPTGDDIKAIHEKALDRAQGYQADLAKQQEAKKLELQQRALAVQQGPQGQPSLLQKEETQKAGVALSKEEAQKQFEQGQQASAESAQLAQPGQPAPFIQALPDDQRLRLEKLESAYHTLNNWQTLHANMLASAIGAGGNARNLIGDLFQTDRTNKYARAYEAYQDESLTPLALGVLGDKAAGATKENIQAQLKGTVPDRSDTLESAGNKIFMMKYNIMDQLQAMRDQNKGKYATGEIGNLYMELSKDFNSPEVQKLNVFSPINQQQQNQQNQSVVQVGNSPEGKAQIASAATAGIKMPSPMTPSPQQFGQTQPQQNQPAQTQQAQPGQTLQQLQNQAQQGYPTPLLQAYGGT